MNKTLIPWVKNPDGSQGYTWNPITGCLNHVNGLCKGGGFPCYAYRLATTRLKERYLENPNVASPFTKRFEPIYHEDPFYPRFWPERLYHPWSSEPRGIFPCDMSDLFGIGIPEEWTRDVLNLCRLHSENRYYLLTKQPQNLPRWSPFPDNCWVGVTATNEETMQKVIYFDDIWAKVRFISFEPLLGRLSKVSLYNIRQNLADWLIIGAQTKPYKPPRIEWVDEIVEAADKADVPVFLKENLKPLLKDDPTATWAFNIDPDYAMRLRQEMPSAR